MVMGGGDIRVGGISGLSAWGMLTLMCIRNLTIIGSDNGLAPQLTEPVMDYC